MNAADPIMLWAAQAGRLVADYHAIPPDDWGPRTVVFNAYDAHVDLLVEAIAYTDAATRAALCAATAL